MSLYRSSRLGGQDRTGQSSAVLEPPETVSCPYNTLHYIVRATTISLVLIYYFFFFRSIFSFSCNSLALFYSYFPIILSCPSSIYSPSFLYLFQTRGVYYIQILFVLSFLFSLSFVSNLASSFIFRLSFFFLVCFSSLSGGCYILFSLHSELYFFPPFSLYIKSC